MIEIYDPRLHKMPIKAWVDSVDAIDETSIRQATDLTKLSQAVSHIALMPDVHAGFGMPIGGVLALEKFVIPNAVGVDIGCGVAFTETSIPAELVDRSTLEIFKRRIMKSIPMGKDHRKNPMPSEHLKSFAASESGADSRLLKEVADAHYQLGTLGGGNHFIELQVNQAGRLCVMVHSGSRHFGHAVATYYHKLAKARDKVAPVKDLSGLSVDDTDGQAYLRWMDAALTFARDNRALMMFLIIEILRGSLEELNVLYSLDVHHNYASEEMVGDKLCWIHRKGAIAAHAGEMGIIPSAMGGLSYLVRGKGSSDAFHSCSHGAGRLMSRKQAIKTFDALETESNLAKKGVLLGVRPRSEITDEDPRAYKDINWVLSQESDLVEVVDSLQSLLVIKG